MYCIQIYAKINTIGFKGLEVCTVRKQVLRGPPGTPWFAYEMCRFSD